MLLKDKRILITGGTGSLGKILVRRLLGGAAGMPGKIIVFSRDEAKQHDMRLEYQNRRSGTDDLIFNNFKQLLEFRIGDVRDYASIARAMQNVDVVINAAALKQVPSCEYFPGEAVKTNVLGPENVVRAVRELRLPIESVVGVSTDKACKPVNVMGMTKAIQERIFISGNIEAPQTRFLCVRYGNVLASRGSVIPLFHEQIRSGGPVTVTTVEMTRFLLSLERAVDTILAALKDGERGETFVPKVRAARMVDVADALIGDRPIKRTITGIRPGEKTHEIMISDEEAIRTVAKGEYYAIKPMLPELASAVEKPALSGEYSSSGDVLSLDGVREMLREHNLLLEQDPHLEGEMLR